MPSEYDLVRAKTEGGAEVTTTRVHAEASGMTVYDDKPAVDQYGAPLASKLDAEIQSKVKGK